MKIDPYLFFEGRCDEALSFYRDALGAEIIAVMRYKESPKQGHIPPGSEEKIMHAELRIGDTTIMASDGMCGGEPNFQGFATVLSLTGEADARRIFQALADGGEVTMPLSKTFYSPLFGMVKDRFGLQWMIMLEE